MTYFRLDGNPIESDNYVQWFHYENPNSEEKLFLTEEMGIPLDFIEDALDRYEVPRLEVTQNKSGVPVRLMLVSYPLIMNDYHSYIEYETCPLAIILLSNRIFTISPSPVHFIEKLQANHSKGSISSSHILLDLLWELTQSYVHMIMDIDKTINEMEQNIINTTKNEAFYKLIAIHKNLVYFDTGITENHEIIKNLVEEEIFSTDRVERELLHDIKVISRQASVMVRESTDMIDHLSEVFSSVISNNLNNIMKFLTSLTIVLTVPTIIGSFWGMNVDLPLDDSPLSFLLLLSISILISIVTVFWLKKKDYL